MELTDRDIALFKILSEYRYLSSTTLHALIGGVSEARFKDRLTVLFHEGLIDRPAQQWQFADCHHVPVIYELGQGANRALKRLDVDASMTISPLSDRVHRQFLHGVMICEVMASIALSLRRFPGTRIVTWRELLDKAPESTRTRHHPLQLPASIASTVGQPHIAVEIEPDSIFGVEYDNAGTKTYRFFALEADRGSMPVVRSDMRQSSYFRKVLAYRDVIARDVHRSHLGLPSLLVLTVTASETRQHQIMDALSQISDASAPFLFKTLPTAGRGGATATLEFASRPWSRVGYPPINIEDPSS